MLMSTQTHIPDKGRKTQRLLIKSLLFALMQGCGIKSFVFVLAPLPLQIMDLSLHLGQAGGLPEPLGLLCHLFTGYQLETQGRREQESPSIPGQAKVSQAVGQQSPWQFGTMTCLLLKCQKEAVRRYQSSYEPEFPLSTPTYRQRRA